MPAAEPCVQWSAPLPAHHQGPQPYCLRTGGPGQWCQPKHTRGSTTACLPRGSPWSGWATMDPAPPPLPPWSWWSVGGRSGGGKCPWRTPAPAQGWRGAVRRAPPPPAPMTAPHTSTSTPKWRSAGLSELVIFKYVPGLNFQMVRVQKKLGPTYLPSGSTLP